MDDIPVPRHWKRMVKRAVLNVISLARYCGIARLGRDAKSRRKVVHLRSRIDELEMEVSQLRDELRLKDARMSRIPPRKRSHYSATERLAILELRAARGLTTKQVAQRFFVTVATICSWMRRLEEGGESALLQTVSPVNRFPDLVRYVIQRLKVTCPRLGKLKIAEILTRAGLHLSHTTVGRILKEQPTAPPAPAAESRALTRARRPGDVWHVDLTVVPTGFSGFWVSWLPFSTPQCWPFCWWVAAVVDGFSRQIQGFAIFSVRPSAAKIVSFMNRAVTQAGCPPRYLVSDREAQFTSAPFKRLCRRYRIRHRFGAVGEKGSIALIERFFLTLKTECTRLIRVPFSHSAFRRELAIFLEWYHEHRPHSGVRGQTPVEMYGDPASTQVASIAPTEIAGVHVTFLHKRRHLPIVHLRTAA